MDKTFQSISEESKPFNETNDCTVIATSVVTGWSYSEAHAALKAAGRKNRKGFSQYRYHDVIRQSGFTIDRITGQFQSKTVRTIERELAANWGGAKIMVNVQGHVLAWNGKEIVDWSAGRQHHIRGVYLVYKDNPPKTFAVEQPKRRKLNRSSNQSTRISIVVSCPELDIHEKRYSSVAAAYRDLGFDLKGHQSFRKQVRYWGCYETGAWHCPSGDSWYGQVMDLIIWLDNYKGWDAYNKHYK